MFQEAKVPASGRGCGIGIGSVPVYSTPHSRFGSKSSMNPCGLTPGRSSNHTSTSVAVIRSASAVDSGTIR